MTIRKTLKRAGWQRTPGTKDNWLLQLRVVTLAIFRRNSGRWCGYVLTDGPGRDYPTLAAAAAAARAAGVAFLLREAGDLKTRATTILEDAARLRGEITQQHRKGTKIMKRKGWEPTRGTTCAQYTRYILHRRLVIWRRGHGWIGALDTGGEVLGNTASECAAKLERAMAAMLRAAASELELDSEK